MNNPSESDQAGVATVTRFNDALNARDLAAMQALLALDTVFENTNPPPDGQRYAGLAAVCAFWEDFLRSSSQAHFEIEEIFGSGDRVVMRWLYRWTDPEGRRGHIRGVDLYRVSAGLIAEKLSYVKG